jgi:hypothetical protein
LLGLLRLAALSLTVALAGCAGTSLPGSVLGGECKVFPRPEFAVRGQTTYDQNWVDDTVESGVGGCKWERPKPRPPALDAPAARRAAPLVLAPVVKKPGIVRRTANRVLHRTPKPAPGEATPLPTERPFDLEPTQPVPYIQPVAPPPPPPPPPKEPVDELLSPATPLPPEPPKRRCRLPGVFC